MYLGYFLIYPAGSHSRQHHAKSHKGCAESVMRRFERALAEVYEIEHKGSEPEAVAELFETDCHINCYKR